MGWRKDIAESEFTDDWEGVFEVTKAMWAPVARDEVKVAGKRLFVGKGGKIAVTYDIECD